MRIAKESVGAVAVVALILLGVNLRFIFGSTSALLSEIKDGYHLDSGAAALLTTGPLVCLGIFGPLAARAIARWSVPVVLTVCLIVVAVGTALRGVPSFWVLLVGALLAGAGIAVSNVLGPVFVRQVFPQRIGPMTGLLTALVTVSAGVASGLSIPIDDNIFHNWRITLSAWAIPGVLGVAAMATVAVMHLRSATTVHEPPRWESQILRSRTAWAVTGFMGLQSVLAYVTIAYLPTMYRDRGVASETAGLMLTTLSVASVVTALIVPMIAVRLRTQSWLIVACIVVSAAGILGALLSGSGAGFFWAVIMGFGQGGSLAGALTLINLRTATAAATTSLSTMAQSIGYVVAASGPLLAGVLHSVTGSWDSVLIALLVLCIPIAICGYLGGRPAIIGAPAREVSPLDEPVS